MVIKVSKISRLKYDLSKLDPENDLLMCTVRLGGVSQTVYVSADRRPVRGKDPGWRIPTDIMPPACRDQIVEAHERGVRYAEWQNGDRPLHNLLIFTGLPDIYLERAPNLGEKLTAHISYYPCECSQTDKRQHIPTISRCVVINLGVIEDIRSTTWGEI